ncbi:hypothetical protein [Paenibacillus sp. MBLB4367]|uniref:hypothetical protein n=1 Tax=Paenibacillus sp. MBLB4367 TaxID=3384767 RepID=UPI0039083822
MVFKWKKGLSLLLAIGFMLSMLGATASAETPGKQVSVTIPGFPVTIDGQKIDSRELKYPLLVYKDITYFPMTWNVGQGMGLSIDWSEKAGLNISPGFGQKAKLEMEKGGDNSLNRRYSATVASFPVQVGSEYVDNASETYPLLLFRDITYFPMTWHFAVESFNWQTAWDDQAGFSIQTWQIPYLSGILYDDETSLYVTTGYNGLNGLFRISKNLDGTPEYLGKAETAAIWKKREAAGTASALKPDEARKTEQKNGALTFEGLELLPLKPIIDENNAYYDANPEYSRHDIAIQSSVYPPGDKDTLVSVRIYTLMHIPGPYTPHSDLLFRVRDGKAEQVNGFDQRIQNVSRTEKGFWLWSYSPQEIRASNAGSFGKIVWLGHDGTVRLWNDVLGVQYLASLDVNGGDVIAQAYNLIGEDRESKPHGYYRLHQNGTYEKIKDTVAGFYPNNAYATGDHRLFVQANNTVTELFTGKSRFWWDYELREAAGGVAQ